MKNIIILLLICNFAQAQLPAIVDGGSKIVTDSLICWQDNANIISYPRSGTTVTDLTRKNNDGTLVNGVTYSNYSLVFDNVNDYMTINSLKYANYNNNFTASFWVYIENTAGGDFAGWGHGNVSPFYYWSVSISTQKILGRVYNGTSYAITSDSITFNRWYNIVFVCNQTGAVDLYVNNVKYSSTFSNPVIKSRTDIYNRTVFGRNPNFDIPYYFNGKLSNILIYNRALNSTEVGRNYNALKNRYQ